ncbi:nitrogen regulation protein NR(II) [Halorhodospira halophila]|uniref:Sensory histidine kinase/phosphatase NtrB n=1 Tax=Halorhodospira halophila (strain DSM 244 / SL1) TaxID=349124 RepID=A1WWC9_HALHL|nr:nitrogen regulation protein NR(II) [Halorhodospira halophila]ABM61991.1 PAS/PAC sensor signal transduction histidine kinase [Halorhodospira halophila SL1]MBK1729681.1 nitrogen regulation protein NR(II) [Halorhodospira halophila]
MEDHERDPSQILEELTTAVLLVDDRVRILHVNHAAETLFRVSSRQVVGQTLGTALRGAELLEELIRQTQRTGGAYTQRERRLPVRGDRPVTVDCTITPVSAKRVLIEIAEVDRHARITREQHLLSQNRAVQELIRGLAHEIKNPLGGLRGAAQLLEAELPERDQREYTQVIIREADRLQQLVDALLGPNAPAREEPVNIHEVLERVRSLVIAEDAEGRAEAPAVALQRDYDPSIPPVTAEHNHLVQAVLNLVRNARQATGPGGTITLRTRTQRQFTIADKPHRLVARIDIIDDGPGIPLDQQEQIFYPMVTSRPEGTGLGLPIAQSLVSRLGGLIECVSEPGRTVFTIWLPMETEND